MIEDAWTASSSANSRQTAYFVAALVLVALCLAHAAALGAVFPIDDAYITLHNAIAFRNGVDESYRGVAPLVGATSSVHVVMVASLLSLMAPAAALLVTSYIGIALYVMGVLRLAFGKGASVLQATALAIVGVTAGNLFFQLLNGLETGLALAIIVWALALMDAPQSDRKSHLVLASLCGTMPFVRPELGALALLLIAHGLLRLRHPKARALFVAVAGVAAAPWLLLHLRASGSPFPSTIGAKRVFYAEGCRPVAQKARLVIERVMIFSRDVGAIAWSSALLVGLRRGGWIGLVFGAVMLGAYFVAFPQALDHYNYRYMYILLPFGFYACAASLRSEESTPRRRAAATALIVIGLADALAGLDDHIDNYMRARRNTIENLDGVAAWSRANLPKDARVLVHDAGYFSYATSFEIHDVVGLKTPSAIAEHTRITWATCGQARGDAVHEVALRLRPDHLVALRPWPFPIAEMLRRHGWQLEELHHSPTNGYDVYRLRPPER